MILIDHASWLLTLSMTSSAFSITSMNSFEFMTFYPVESNI